MNPASIIPDILLLTLTFTGFGALSASTDRHAKQIFGKIPPPNARRLRSMLGWGLLALALWPAIHAYGLSIGISMWTGMLALASTAIALLLTYRPAALPRAAAAAAICAVAALASL